MITANIIMKITVLSKIKFKRPWIQMLIEWGKKKLNPKNWIRKITLYIKWIQEAWNMYDSAVPSSLVEEHVKSVRNPSPCQDQTPCRGTATVPGEVKAWSQEHSLLLAQHLPFPHGGSFILLVWEMWESDRIYFQFWEPWLTPPNNFSFMPYCSIKKGNKEKKKRKAGTP